MLSTITALVLNWELISHYLNIIAMVSGYIGVVATLIVRFTKTKTDDQFVESISSGFLRVMLILPTWGINPNTKKAIDLLQETKTKAEEQEKSEEAS